MTWSSVTGDTPPKSSIPQSNSSRAGARFGGVSPVTDDHVNPDYAWPALAELEAVAEEAGVPLRERLPVYERFLPDDLRTPGFDGRPADGADEGRWLSAPIRRSLEADDDAGERYRAVLSGRP